MRGRNQGNTSPARPILQEYDASTVDEVAVNPAEFGNLAARHNLVEIEEACRKEAKLFKLASRNPASVQPVEIVDARLLARPILQA